MTERMDDRNDGGPLLPDPGLAWAAGGVHLATVTRGGEPDSVHFGMACIVDADGRVIWSLGDAAARAFFRSSAKPLQALPVIDSGAADALGLDDSDLAVICGSHSGGPDPMRQVRGILSKCGLDERHLGCGDGVADQCSGKHAGMLAGCRHLGLPLDGYLEADHPWQRGVLETLSTRCGLGVDEIALALDGCSAPTYGLPLYNMALGYARMGRDAARPGAEYRGPARLFRAMVAGFIHTGEPDMRGFPTASPSGSDTPGEAGSAVPVTKGGANGLHCAALPALGLGFALKISDGSAAARWPVFTGALQRAGLVRPEIAALMRTILWPPVASRRGEATGEIRLAF
jgi:L-asparaginase II